MKNAGELNENQLDCFVQPRAAEELYDVKKDPYQFNNLAENKEYENALNEMRGILDAWIVEYNDQVPAKPTPDKFDRWTGKKLLP